VTSDEQQRPHSAAYFGPERDFWWNADHLALIAARRALGDVRTVLDVGSGVGHWGTLLASVLSGTATITGVEREPRWVAEATGRAERLGLAGRCSYRQGRAEALPFEDASFDLVTCQTVLIHVADAPAVIREMLRVTRPGGHVIAAEPNNLVSSIVATNLSAAASIVDLIDDVRFCLTCERGKIALGEGNDSVGDLLPGYFAEAGLVDIEAFLSDKTSMMLPPYASPQQQALRDTVVEAARSGDWGRSRSEAHRLFAAGGGDDARFDAAWERATVDARAAADAIEAGTFHGAMGCLHYLVAGRRPG
jgi:SAM-dependent methyltransferase